MKSTIGDKQKSNLGRNVLLSNESSSSTAHSISTGGDQSQLQEYKVDTERSKSIVRRIHETEQLGTATAFKINQQGFIFMLLICYLHPIRT